VLLTKYIGVNMIHYFYYKLVQWIPYQMESPDRCILCPVWIFECWTIVRLNSGTQTKIGAHQPQFLLQDACGFSSTSK